MKEKRKQEDQINIGILIRELRKEKNLTQAQLAQLLSTTQDTISLWELGKSLPDIVTVIKLSKIFGVSSDYLLNLEA